MQSDWLKVTLIEPSNQIAWFQSRVFMTFVCWLNLTKHFYVDDQFNCKNYKIKFYRLLCKWSLLKEALLAEQEAIIKSLKVSGGGSVGKAVASDTRGLRFKSQHRQSFYWIMLTVNCIEKTKIKKKRPVVAHFLKKNLWKSNHVTL